MDDFGSQPPFVLTVRDHIAIEVYGTLLRLTAEGSCPADRAGPLAAEAAYHAADELLAARSSTQGVKP